MEKEYIKALSPDEKIIFLQIIFNLGCADKKVEQEEKGFIKKLLKDYELPSEKYPQVLQMLNKQEIIERINNISSIKKKYALFIELFMMANIDDDLDEREIDYILDLAESVNIPYEKMEEINRYALDKIQCLRKYKEIMEN